ncbi:MAG: hypothetical protein ABIJ21_04885 [Nanoarchaeota archaeon]
MAGVKRLFWELKAEVMKISFFRAFLNTVIFFLIINIILTFFRIRLLYGGILAAVFLIVNTYINYASVTLKKIEDANPEVREMLRTAKDTLKQDNIMIRALHEEILGKAKQIYSGNLMSYKAFFGKLVIIACLIIATLFTSTIHIDRINIPFDKLTFGAGVTTGDIPVVLDDISLEESDDIYGEARVAKLGNELIELQINPSMSELDMNNLKDEEGIALSRNSFPVDIGSPGGAQVSGTKKPEESELVNAFYLKKIKK